ncbi:hypothetical protein Xoosp14_228 [Xanthomonas phage Xoo-sp14]|nr:hypothetical protein Xoosp14_228 [Xanthomonas phage Xoo-sp14]
MSKYYKARDIAAMSHDELWEIPDGLHEVEFDDGVTEVKGRYLILSSYVWRFVNEWPETPLLKAHLYTAKEFSNKDFLKLLGTMLFNVFDTYDMKREPADIEDLCKFLYEIVNTVYNNFTLNCEENATSLDILDLIEVVDYPEIAAAKAAALPTQRGIKKAHAAIKDSLMDAEGLSHNATAKIARRLVAPIDQIIQCIGPRGFITDIASVTFREPVMSGYIEGLNTLYEFMIEAQSASKSLLFNKDPLADSEYHNRKQQLSANVVRRVERGDCGTPYYTNFNIKASDLRAFAGKYYYDNDGKLQILKETDRHLHGAKIKMRSVPHCQHKDHGTVCSTCFGELWISIPRDTNLGHVAATVFCKLISQLILSTKHLDSNASVDEIHISDMDKLYIQVADDPNQIQFTELMGRQKFKMVIHASEAKYLSDVNFVSEVDQLPISRMSEMTAVKLVIGEGSNVQVMVVPVEMNGRKAYLTYDILDYIKRKSWTINHEGNIVIDMSEFDVEKPAFELPQRHINMVDYMRWMEAFLRSSGRSERKKLGIEKRRVLSDFNSIDAALAELYEMASSKLTVPIAYLEVLMYSTMVRDPENRDHRLPKGGDPIHFGTFGDNMTRRSLTGILAYQDQIGSITNIESYILRHRPPHVLDEMVIG